MQDGSAPRLGGKRTHFDAIQCSDFQSREPGRCHSSTSRRDNIERCAVCLQPFEVPDTQSRGGKRPEHSMAIIKNCGHVLHAHCWTEMIEHIILSPEQSHGNVLRSLRCPTCRKSMVSRESSTPVCALAFRRTAQAGCAPALPLIPAPPLTPLAGWLPKPRKRSRKGEQIALQRNVGEDSRAPLASPSIAHACLAVSQSQLVGHNAHPSFKGTSGRL